MKRSLYTIIIFALLLSCEHYPEPGSETLEQFYCSVIGNNQSAEGLQYLSEEVGAQIDFNSLITSEVGEFKMEITVSEGGGIVDNDVLYPDENGVMTTKWQLGNDTNNQLLTCRILDSDNKQYVEFTIVATAYFYNNWNTITQGNLIGIQDMIADTINHRSMMLSHGDIWKSSSEPYSWIRLGFPFPGNIRMLDMSSDGTVFAAVWNGTLYKSEDWGENWSYITKPIPNNDYYYSFNITSDDYLWASKAAFGVYCSKDKGLTWTQDSTTMIKESTLGPIYKYGSSYLTMSSNPTSIIQTKDEGITWDTINTPEYSLSMYVPNDSTIIAQNQGGFKLHKSTDDGESFKLVLAPYTTMGRGEHWHTYNKFKNNYYIMVPSSGVWKTRDFKDFEHLISLSTYQHRLFIDHKGNIYASGYNYINADPEHTFVFAVEK
ncbi:WD40/YVTN/BNR-like repeat-containing protein [Draconibacterium halophilum]|uniref:Sortilin N-terminal domain-containing protein n=1 Tax=Draconibacterium halophilum TaxID=2706887 RepID=A0A6C0RC43_9BACT|nr:hypothetical protein [Draconibacterium halophilum]QIA07053.1 hypothetical protein G0Q07_04585 [Draconibacterium halophilum]